MGRPHRFGVLLGCAALLVASCATTLQGKPVSIFADPFRVAGLPAVNGETGLRPDAPGPSRVVLGTDGGDIDGLARNAVTDIEEFWADAYPEAFGDEFKPVKNLLSWDSDGKNSEFCGADTVGLVNAAYCVKDDTIGWDRGEMLPGLRDADGDMAVSMVVAHEYGHAIQRQAAIADMNNTPVLVREQQADCLAGVYMRWVAEGKSRRFVLSTGEGLNNLLAAMIGLRDPLVKQSDPDNPEDPHGSAFERVSAFQFGFTDGASACAAINPAEIKQRRGALPVFLPEQGTTEREITKDSVRQQLDAMGIVFPLPDPPKLVFDGAGCPDSRSADPAIYCPSTNTIGVDLAALQNLGRNSDKGGLANGDNTAYSVVVSRYMLALQHERGAKLDDAEAALRTACLTGVATARLTKPITTRDGETVALTAGDVDEAVSGILADGFVASDVNGETVPAGFSRIDAFRIGVLGDEGRCFKRFA